MSNRGSLRGLHPALALAVALALHAIVWLGSRWLPRSPAHALPPVAAADLELSLELADGAAGSPAETANVEALPTPVSPQASGWRERVRATVRRAPQAAVSRDRGEVEGVESEAGGGSVIAPGGASRGELPRKPIDLGLNGGVRLAALLGECVERPPRTQAPSDGGLSQGLAALDAERGLSRSSAAHHAAHRAARRFAPPTGRGTFDITTDEHGVVLSVTLASALANEADWQRVGEELRELLKDRRLRVPPGARGLLARLRIETGELAQDNAERFRTARGTALGQAPLHPRELRAESTRSSLEPGQLSPTLGVSIGGGGTGPGIRVVLVEERRL